MRNKRQEETDRERERERERERGQGRRNRERREREREIEREGIRGGWAIVFNNQKKLKNSLTSNDLSLLRTKAGPSWCKQ